MFLSIERTCSLVPSTKRPVFVLELRFQWFTLITIWKSSRDGSRNVLFHLQMFIGKKNLQTFMKKTRNVCWNPAQSRPEAFPFFQGYRVSTECCWCSHSWKGRKLFSVSVCARQTRIQNKHRNGVRSHSALCLEQKEAPQSVVVFNVNATNQPKLREYACSCNIVNLEEQNRRYVWSSPVQKLDRTKQGKAFACKRAVKRLWRTPLVKKYTAPLPCTFSCKL